MISVTGHCSKSSICQTVVTFYQLLLLYVISFVIKPNCLIEACLLLLQHHVYDWQLGRHVDHHLPCHQCSGVQERSSRSAGCVCDRVRVIRRWLSAFGFLYVCTCVTDCACVRACVRMRIQYAYMLYVFICVVWCAHSASVPGCRCVPWCSYWFQRSLHGSRPCRVWCPVLHVPRRPRQ